MQVGYASFRETRNNDMPLRAKGTIALCLRIIFQLSVCQAWFYSKRSLFYSQSTSSSKLLSLKIPCFLLLFVLSRFLSVFLLLSPFLSNKWTLSLFLSLSPFLFLSLRSGCGFTRVSPNATSFFSFLTLSCSQCFRRAMCNMITYYAI